MATVLCVCGHKKRFDQLFGFCGQKGQFQLKFIVKFKQFMVLMWWPCNMCVNGVGNLVTYIYQNVWSHATRRYCNPYPPLREPNTYIINLITKCSLSIHPVLYQPSLWEARRQLSPYLRPSVGNTVGERWMTCHVSHLIRLQAMLESFADHLLPMTPSLTHKIIKTNRNNLRRALNLSSACPSWNFAIP